MIQWYDNLSLFEKIGRKWNKPADRSMDNACEVFIGYLIDHWNPLTARRLFIETHKDKFEWLLTHVSFQSHIFGDAVYIYLTDEDLMKYKLRW